ncbi:sugar transporter [Polymorphobacter glacialis]|uniref:Sugar transporter n=2 Tax=Sandarakinorhabdus glacialis TaxID=1614636 RepID=A0A916ZTL2_9SPHN|nr:sugar transporter [Polymorphobacter glacialis]
MLYGSGTVAFGVKDQGFNALLMLFYNQVVGLPAAWVGAAIMIAMVADALFDPLLGQYSDNFRSRLGRRHPFMYAAALPIAISYLFLWSPPEMSQGGQFAWLVTVAIIVRFSISLYEIPSTALLAEFTSDYDERTKLVAARYFFGVLGGLTMTILTFQFFLKATPTHPVGQLNPDGYVTYAWVAAAVMLVSVLVSSLGTQKHMLTLPVLPPAPRFSLRVMLREILSIFVHRSYVSILLASLFFAIASGLNTALAVYFSTYFWELSPSQIAGLASSGIAGIVLAMVVVLPLSARFGKKRSAMALFVLSMFSGVTPLFLRSIDLFPPNGDPLLLPILMVQYAFSVTCVFAGAILAVSMVADVTDQIQLETGQRSEGLLFSAVILVNKAVSGMGVFLSGLLLALVAFPAQARPGQVAPEVLSSLAITYIAAIMVTSTVAIICLAFYPINRADHAENIRKLGERAG